MRCFLMALTAVVLPCAYGGTVIETETNNTFAQREILNSSTTIFNGSVSCNLTPDYCLSGDLAPDMFVAHALSGLIPGTPFFAWTNNDPNNNGVGPDTILGSFDQFGNLISKNDDRSLAGTRTSSAILGQKVNSDGSINLHVSGYQDTEVNGGWHDQSGPYDLYVMLGVPGPGDVDFLSVTGLKPGDRYYAEILAATFDTVLGLFDQDGNLIAFDDDGGVDRLSLLDGLIVPSNGILSFAVSSYNDANFIGDHCIAGDYSLSLTKGRRPIMGMPMVPEPSSMLILATGSACFAFRRRRKA